MKVFYLIATIVGIIVPYVFFAPFFAEHGFDIGMFSRNLFVNGPAGGFTADVLISSAVFWGIMFSSRMLPLPLKIVCLALNLCAGLSAALPFYAYLLQTRKERELEARS